MASLFNRALREDLYLSVLKSEKKKKNFFNIEEEVALSLLFFDEDALLARTLRRARALAAYIVEERLTPQALEKALAALSTVENIQYPLGGFDVFAGVHMKKQLTHLKESAKLRSLILAQKPPVANPFVERLVLRSLGRNEKMISAEHIQEAVLSALLTPLRQNVGSCFATAPCIVIQSDQIDNFLIDITTLINTGKLERVIEGAHYSVPMSVSGGVGLLKKNMPPPMYEGIVRFLGGNPPKTVEGGRTLEEYINQCKSAVHLREAAIDLTDHALLKAWEFTVASFSDYKVEIFKWNLHASLGFNHEIPQGIGEHVYAYLQEKLEEKQRDLERLEQEYEQAFFRVKLTENRLRQADTSEKARRAEAEHGANLSHFYACEKKRDEAVNSGKLYSDFFAFLMNSYMEEIPKYFQELYDPEMVDAGVGIYEDAPAGFRLLFKHGRKDPSVWTFIYAEKEFIAALVDFFRMTEHEIAERCTWETGKGEIGHITTSLLYFIQNPLFIDSAKKRIHAFHTAHGIEVGKFKTPWSYISGGTVQTLLQCYFSRKMPLAEESAQIETPAELLLFFVETMKNVQGRIASKITSGNYERMVAYSPNHAFTLLPKESDFFAAWNTNTFTYTWLRDHFFQGDREIYEKVRFTFEEGKELVRQAGGNEKALPRGSCSIEELFASGLAPAAKLAAAIRSSVPFVPQNLLTSIPQPLLEKLPPTLPFAVAKAYLSEETLSKAGYKKAHTVIFADTNWSHYFFAFAINPLTKEIDLWRVDPSGDTGVPMQEWKNLFTQGQKPWGLYINVDEYSTSISTAIETQLRRV